MSCSYLSRFQIALLAVFACSIFASIASADSSASTNGRPNILFCIADDWGWPHAGAYGDPVVKTPTFDRIAKEGILFEHAYVSSPSCTPSRNAILTGQFHWRLSGGRNLHSVLDTKHKTYPHLLEDAGYFTGHWRKSWGPGKVANWMETEKGHPAGDKFKNFDAFLESRPCLLYTSPSPRDLSTSRVPSSA